jgi:hypothetical protein
MRVVAGTASAQIKSASLLGWVFTRTHLVRGLPAFNALPFCRVIFYGARSVCHTLRGTTMAVTPSNTPNPTNERRLGMAAAARWVGALRGERPTSPYTVVRWITVGALLPDGSRLRLEGQKFGNTWTTTVASLERWAAALTQAHFTDHLTAESSRGEKRQQRIGEKAGEELAASGW